MRIAGAGAPPPPRVAAAHPSGRQAAPSSVLTRSRWLAILAMLAAAGVLTIVAALRFGAEDISFPEAVGILLQAGRGGPSAAASHDSAAIILLQVRLPRALPAS